MGAALEGRSLLTLSDFSGLEIRSLLDLAARVKNQRRHGERHERFRGLTIALIFEKRSTRTRCAFETSFGEEGGYPVFLSPADIHLGVKESVEDTARVLGRMFDCIQFRGYAQETARILAGYSGVPVYNGLTDDFHPTQALADILTLEEAFGDSRGRTLCYVGDGRNNVANSLLIICGKLGVNITIVSPPELAPAGAMVSLARSFAEESGAGIEITSDIDAGVRGADCLYTDVWVSMGEEDKLKERMELLTPYRVDGRLMEKTENPECRFMHCLPAVKGNEVTAEVIEGPMSMVWDEAENRKHTIKALMLATLGLA